MGNHKFTRREYLKLQGLAAGGVAYDNQTTGLKITHPART